MPWLERLSVGSLAVACAVEAAQLRQVVSYRSETAQDSPDEIGPFGAVVDAFWYQLEFPEERFCQSRSVRSSRIVLPFPFLNSANHARITLGVK